MNAILPTAQGIGSLLLGRCGYRAQLAAAQADALVARVPFDDRLVQPCPARKRKRLEAASQVVPIGSPGVEATHCLRE